MKRPAKYWNLGISALVSGWCAWTIAGKLGETEGVSTARTAVNVALLVAVFSLSVFAVARFRTMAPVRFWPCVLWPALVIYTLAGIVNYPWWQTLIAAGVSFFAIIIHTMTPGMRMWLRSLESEPSQST